MSNPYRSVWRRQRRNRLASEPVSHRWLRGAFAVVAVGVAVVLARPLLFGALVAGDPARADRVEFLVVRGGLLLVAAGAIGMFDALIRSDDRPVLDRLPVDGRGVVAATLERVVAEYGPWLAAMLAAGLPYAVSVSWFDYGVASVALVGLAGLAVAGAAMTHLLAVEVAEHPAWVPVLDAIRGRNPREQAAFLYAPGVVFAASGALAYLVGGGVHQVISGHAGGWLYLLIPYPLAITAAVAAVRLGGRHWVQAGAVRAEIDARYASVERPEEATRVYLDWLPRWLPRASRAYALRDLRHGWRARRVFVTGPWLVGVFAAIVGLSGDPHAPARVAGILAVSGAVFGAAALQLERDEPAFLRVWFPPGGAAALWGRSVVGAAWQVGAVVPAIGATLLIHGPGPALAVLGVGAAGTVAVPWASACARWPRAGVWVYAVTTGGAALVAAGRLIGEGV